MAGSDVLRYEKWLRSYHTTAMVDRAAAVPLCHDAQVLLAYVRDNSVVGTQSTGNMPLKHIRAVTAHFQHPPVLDNTIGDHVYKLRSEDEVWQLQFIHILLDVGGLVETPRGRRWRLTDRAEQYLAVTSLQQMAFLAAIWWYQVNWLVASLGTGLGEALPQGFERLTLARLRALPVGMRTSFESFADGLIADAGLIWGSGESEYATMLLRGAIRRMVANVMRDLGILELETRPVPLGSGMVAKLLAVKKTALGKALLTYVADQRLR